MPHPSGGLDSQRAAPRAAMSWRHRQHRRQPDLHALTGEAPARQRAPRSVVLGLQDEAEARTPATACPVAMGRPANEF